ncbi:MAG: D-alanyl-D-alanine carboxypeptidase [Candidatus Rokubacteria bacterium]|nr:D-alanyl-D-alanine carboxypeptidase [Candidatus Rokubacteria bacterium]
MHPTRLLVPLAALAAVHIPASVDAQGAPALSPNGRLAPLSAESALLVDPEGKTLFAKNAEDERAPASLVKLMTLFLAYEDLDRGKVNIEEPVQVSHYAALTPQYRMGLRGGEWVPLRALMEGVAIASANDAATALAERLAGDETAFVERMNAKAGELGLTGTRFVNAHGLPDPSQRSTARDLAQLTAHLLRDYPASRTLLGGQTFVYAGRVYARHIPLFNDPVGVQALKTGFTREAGYNLAVSAWRGGQQFVMIVLGSRSRSLSFLDAKRLLHYAFVEAGLEPDGRPRPEPRRLFRARPTTVAR